MRDLEKMFHQEMLLIYTRAKSECKYNATRFFQMVNEHGGVEAARILLRSPLSEGFAALWSYGRLDLSMEALVLQSSWKPLFTSEELAIAEKRLKEAGYKFDLKK